MRIICYLASSSLIVVSGCTDNKITCGEGTHEENGLCMPDDLSDTDSDTDTDTDTDTDIDIDIDGLNALVLAWEAANLSINDGMGYTNHSNQEAILSQNEDAILEAILEMYRATNDLEYLQLFVQHADLVLAWRDDNAGFVDYTGQSNPVWSNAYDLYFEGGNAYPFLLESGQLTWPLADFAQLVLGDEGLELEDAGDGRTLFTVAIGYV